MCVFSKLKFNLFYIQKCTHHYFWSNKCSAVVEASRTTGALLVQRLYVCSWLVPSWYHWPPALRPGPELNWYSESDSPLLFSMKQATGVHWTTSSDLRAESWLPYPGTLLGYCWCQAWTWKSVPRAAHILWIAGSQPQNEGVIITFVSA